MRPFRKWLYIKAFNAVARLAPADVRKVHLEVFNRGFKAYEEARTVAVSFGPAIEKHVRGEAPKELF